jgi:phage shock protein PspC (stress-responsive transcriptional regulator)
VKEKKMSTVQDQNTTNTPGTANQQAEAWYSNAGQGAAQNAASSAGQIGSRPQFSTRRMLYRHPSDKLVGGVCGGLAEYLGWEPVLVRVAWVVATFASWGGGLLAYILLALFLPVGNNTVGQVKPPALELSQKGMSWGASLLIALGGLWLLANLGILPGMWRTVWGVVGILFWPAVLIGAGYLLLRANSTRDIDQEVANAAAKVKGAFNGKLPSGEQVKSGFSSLRSNLPLSRSNSNRVLLGVCGGLGEKYGIDANLIRLIWAAFALGTMGMGALLYFVVGLLLPAQGQYPVAASRNGATGETVQNINIVQGE